MAKDNTLSAVRAAGTREFWRFVLAMGIESPHRELNIERVECSDKDVCIDRIHTTFGRDPIEAFFYLKAERGQRWRLFYNYSHIKFRGNLYVVWESLLPDMDPEYLVCMSSPGCEDMVFKFPIVTEPQTAPSHSELKERLARIRSGVDTD